MYLCMYEYKLCIHFCKNKPVNEFVHLCIERSVRVCVCVCVSVGVVIHMSQCVTCMCLHVLLLMLGLCMLVCERVSASLCA